LRHSQLDSQNAIHCHRFALFRYGFRRLLQALLRCVSEGLDFHIYAGGQIQLH
jgi:hypothetical protein